MRSQLVRIHLDRNVTRRKLHHLSGLVVGDGSSLVCRMLVSGCGMKKSRFNLLPNAAHASQVILK